MTNFEKIKKMSMDDMAMTIMCPYDIFEFEKKPCKMKNITSCYKCTLNWLEREAEK